jgi:hypothetical protein
MRIQEIRLRSNRHRPIIVAVDYPPLDNQVSQRLTMTANGQLTQTATEHRSVAKKAFIAFISVVAPDVVELPGSASLLQFVVGKLCLIWLE